MRSGKRSNLGFLLGLTFAALLFALSYPVSWLADYYSHRNQLSSSVKNGDRDGAQAALEDLKADYGIFLQWKLQYPADRFFFNKMYLYEAAVSLLNEDYERVEKDHLKGRDDWESAYISGVSKFLALHAAYQEAMAGKNKAKMDSIVGIVLDQVRPDFEKCVRSGPGPLPGLSGPVNFNCSFNYDLTSDPASARKALANPKPKVIYALGPDGDKPGPGKGRGKKKSPKQGTDDKDNSAGAGGARKIG